MKKLILLLMLGCISYGSFSQRWELFKNDLSHFTTPTPNIFLANSISTDSLAFTLKLDTIINYSNRKVTLFEGDYNDYLQAFPQLCLSFGPSILGDSLVEFLDSRIYFTGSNQLIWKNSLQWTFYKTANNEELTISLDTVYALNGDSLKRYSFSASNMSAFDAAIFSTPILVSKSKGIIEGFDFSYFPSEIRPISYFYDGLITTTQIYDYEIGDEYHYEVQTNLNINYGTYDRFIKKVIGKILHAQDSVTYTFQRQVRDDELVVVNNNPFPTHQYTNFQDTVSETYQLGSTILSGSYLDGLTLSTLPFVIGNLGIYDSDFNEPSIIDFEGMGNSGDTICDYTFEIERYTTYVFGVGSFYHFTNGDINSYYYSSEELVYYKKGLKTWGNPLILPLSVNENSLSKISYYPNPVKDQLTIENLKENTIYKLININGALVNSGSLQATPNSISMVDLLPGVYLLQLQTQNEFKTLKLVKE